MEFLQKLLQGIAFVPGVVGAIENLFSGRSGQEKKDAAMSFVSAALGLAESISNRQVVNEVAFKQGLAQVIDGTVQCLNSSAWAKGMEAK